MRYFICTKSEESQIPIGSMFKCNDLPKDLVTANIILKELSETNYYLLYSLSSNIFEEYLLNTTVLYYLDVKEGLVVIYHSPHPELYVDLLENFRDYKSADILSFYKLCLEKGIKIDTLLNYKTLYIVGYDLNNNPIYKRSSYYNQLFRIPLTKEVELVVKRPWYKRILGKK